MLANQTILDPAYFAAAGIEFYGKVMEWHTRWTENSRTLYHLTSYRSSLVAELHAWRKLGAG